MAKVFVITGPSGVGKGTLISKLLDRVPELELSVSATTREPRDGEVDGREYHFLDLAEFDRLVEEGAFLEHATYSGNRYGTLRSEVEERRTDDAATIDRRLRTAEEELAAEGEFRYVVINDDIEAAVGELERIVRDELAAE